MERGGTSSPASSRCTHTSPIERTRIAVASPADAHRIVDSLAALELDFLKIRTVQDRATYLAINEAANRHGLRLVGHVLGLPPELVLEAGQDGIEHFFYPTLDSLSHDERMALWRRLRDQGAAVVPTLVTITEATFRTTHALRRIVEDSLGEIEPRRPYLSRFLVLDWREQVLEHDEDSRALYERIYESTTRNLREMHEAGVPVLAGSDVAALNIFPGSTLRDELALFVRDLGMTPVEALERATSRSAAWLGIGDSVGTIEPGKIADLVLLGDDPRADIANVGRIDAVVLRGRLLQRDDLARVLDDVRRAPDIRLNDWTR